MASTSRRNRGFINNVPDIVIDKILELLPTRMAARTSVLSKQWRRSWLSLRRLEFDHEFWKELRAKDRFMNWDKYKSIISTVLHHHTGPVHDITIHISQDVGDEGCTEGSPFHEEWLSFLSENGARRIKLENDCDRVSISSNIFKCTELVELHLHRYLLDLPPTSFSGFPKLKYLALHGIGFCHEDVFSSLVTKCPMLAALRIEYCVDIDLDGLVMGHILMDILIDNRSLETLTIVGDWKSLAFGDVQNLTSISLNLEYYQPTDMGAIVDVKLLASSCQLECIDFDSNLCRFLGDEGGLRRSSVAFNYLNKLCLRDVNLVDSSFVKGFLGLIESCPHIEELDISMSLIDFEAQAAVHKLDYELDNNLKLDRLLVVKIFYLTGSSAELELIAYLLAISSVLENLVFASSHQLNTVSELQLSRALLRLPRASTQARIVYSSL